jgi:uncharacterized protein
MKVEIKVIPNARKRAVTRDGAGITVRLTSQPIEGKANDELVRYLSDLIKVKKSAIKILRGEKDRHKLVEIPIDEKDLDALFNETVSRES